MKTEGTNYPFKMDFVVNMNDILIIYEYGRALGRKSFNAIKIYI